MRRSPDKGLWIVIQSIRGIQCGIRSVYQQDDWEEIDARNPGEYQVVQSGISNESEAELLARGTSGDNLKPIRKQRP